MAEREDNYENALVVLKAIRKHDRLPARAVTALALMANAYATLALADQQRIANEIRMREVGEASDA